MSNENETDTPETTQALQTSGKMPLEMGQRGLQLSNLDDAWRFCTAMASTGMMPKGMGTAQQILYALELGFEVGLPPLAAVQSIAVINGRASLYGDVMLGLVMASGKFCDETFEEDWIRDDKQAVIGAYCVVRRLPKGKPRRWDFTIEDAKTANLWGKEGPWRTAPKRMLQMRARAFALRDIFPDVLRGIITREEASDIPPEKNVTDKTAVTRPTNISELTDKLIAEAPSVAETSLAAEESQAGVGQETVADEKPQAESVAPEKAKAKTTKAETKKAAPDKPAETAAPVAAPPPKPPAKPEPAPETAKQDTQAQPEQAAASTAPPEGSKEFRGVLFLKEEMHGADSDKHSPAQLTSAQTEAKRIGISLDKFVEKRLGAAIADFSTAGMDKLIAMLKSVG